MTNNIGRNSITVNRLVGHELKLSGIMFLIKGIVKIDMKLHEKVH